MGVSLNGGTPQTIHFNRVFHYKPSILGYCNPIFGNIQMLFMLTNRRHGIFQPWLAKFDMMRRKKNEDYRKLWHITHGDATFRVVEWGVISIPSFRCQFAFPEGKKQSVCSSKWHSWQLNPVHITFVGKDKDGDKTVAAHAKKVIEAS